MHSSFRFILWAAACFGGWGLGAPAFAQARPPAAPTPTVVEAQTIRGTPDQQTVAEGEAELRRDDVTIRADRLIYDQRDNVAKALGNVTVVNAGNTFTGPELQLQVDTYAGFFLSPNYVLAATGASGRAERIDFLDRQRSITTQGTYSTCTPEDHGQLDWVLSARRMKLDYNTNEGVAEGAVLRFMGVPILGAPSLTFPLSSARKSGWLPPTIEVDSRNGLQVSAPYYWNIAPQMDATFAPQAIVRRGVGLNSQFRYLGQNYRGTTDFNYLPNDQLAQRSRYGLNMAHSADWATDTRVGLQVMRVSDDDYWKDFRQGVGSMTPRLLMSELSATNSGSEWTTYARAQGWQVLQSTAPGEFIAPPYQRLPQLGARTLRSLGGGLRLDFEGEFNRFGNPEGTPDALNPTGSRLHSVTSISRPWVSPAWTLTPKVTLNAASYEMDAPLTTGPYSGQRSANRVIPTVSLDNSWVLERDSNWFGTAMRQTLEPRVLYSYTPYRDQTGLPNFDSALKDFNFESIYTENPFSGVDRVADTHQITAGVSTRLIDSNTGGEALRLGLAQRYLLDDQRITATGVPSGQRFSDVYLLGSTTVVPKWGFNATLQYNPELAQVRNSLVSATFSPGPLRTVSASYQSDRGALAEQLIMGWQWPVYGPTSSTSRPLITASAASAGHACRGTWYSVGRVSFNTRDNKVIDSILGMEYDGGCWIGRIVGRRQATGLNESVTGVGIQLELVGFSRLGFGSNPMQLLKENVGGYTPLRNGSGANPAGSSF